MKKIRVLMYTIIYSTVFLLQIYAAQAADPAVQTAIARFAPHVYLHPMDRYRPSSVENFLAHSVLKFGDTVIATAPTAEMIAGYGSEDYRLIPSAAFYSGDPIVNGRCTAPMYVHVVEHTDYTDISYSFFYPFNGYQPFRIGIKGFFTVVKQNFEWADFGHHEGDWEHVTVRVTPDLATMTAVYYAQHGGGQWVAPPNIPLLNGHPVAYSALNTHATYPAKGIFTQAEITELKYFIPFTQINWLKVVDTTDTSDLKIYARPNPYFSTVEWKPWENNGLVLLDDDNDFADTPWVHFRGIWGGITDHIVRKPPALYANAHEVLYGAAKIAGFLDIIPSEFLSDGGGSSSLITKGYWTQER